MLPRLGMTMSLELLRRSRVAVVELTPLAIGKATVKAKSPPTAKNAKGGKERAQ